MNDFSRLPYAFHWIEEEDIQSVVDVLRTDWITTGPKINEFEQAFARFVGTKEAVAVSSGTAALHAAMQALNIGPGDEVLVPTMTFVASANSVVFQGGTPVFVDVEPDTLLLDLADVEKKMTSRTRAILTVDYAGQPCDYDALNALAKHDGLTIIADSCHSLGALYKGRPVGSLASLNTFSFHPAKHITTGEGGMITTDDRNLADTMRAFRNHGIASDPRQRAESGSWFYEMNSLGYNYRLSDFQCALGISQLKKLPSWVARRQEIAKYYNEAFSGISAFQPLVTKENREHAYHLYVIQLNGLDRRAVFQALCEKGIQPNVHYIPVHLQPFYQRTFHTTLGNCPVAEAASERIISLPLFPRMTDRDVERVVQAVLDVMDCHAYHLDTG